MTLRGRLPLHVAVVCSLLLVPIGLGWIPAFRYAWGFGLWQYLPAGARFACAAGVVLLCWPAARGPAIDAVARLREAVPRAVPRAARAPLAVGALALVFWLLRERAFFGDSKILTYAAASGTVFRFPDLGATWIFHVAHQASEALRVPGLDLLQALVCIAGALALYGFARFAALLAGEGSAALVLALIFCGGVLRVFFGHVEVYAFVLLCAGGYFWAALAHLRGNTGFLPAALALGVGIWVHPSFVALAPSLLLAIGLRAREEGASVLPRAAAAAALAAAPLVLFAVAMLAAGHGALLAEAWSTALRIAGVREGGTVEHYFVRGWFGSPSRGTDFVLLSPPHLKYLANSSFVLAPASVPVLLGFALGARRRFVESPDAVFLTTACAGLALYALLLRPIWGPYDWDLFSLTAVAAAALAALLLVRSLEATDRAHVAAVLVGVSLLFVTLPLVAVGFAPGIVPEGAGPFAEGVERAAGESGWEALRRQIEPWL